MISKAVPQDQVESILELRGLDDSTAYDGNEKEEYIKVYKKLKYDLPNFYFSIIPAHYPDNINKILNPQIRNTSNRIIKQNYQSDKVIPIITEITSLQGDKSINQSDLNKFFRSADPAVLVNSNDVILHKFGLQLSKTKVKWFLPKVVWHGLQNQYHNWFSSILKGSFGNSMVDGSPVIKRVKQALLWTLSLALCTIFFAYPLAILLASFINLYPNSYFFKVISQFLYFTHSIPTFWMATMLVMYFTTDDYGTWTNIFPSVGINIYPDKSLITQIYYNSHKLILPIVCTTLHSLAFLTRILSRSIHDQLSQPYITTAYSKGLSRKNVILKHALPNALIPFITLFVASFPVALSGSVITEVIFNIPGLGRLFYNSITVADWNVTFCVLTFIATVTVISYLIGDFLYAWINPKIRFS